MVIIRSIVAIIRVYVVVIIGDISGYHTGNSQWLSHGNMWS